MQVIEVDPKKCVRWKLADRSGFEFGDIHGLAQDILKNGQIEPVILRKVKNSEDNYEVIAGSRRWKACLEASVPLKGIVQNLSDEQAAVAQIKENQHVSICDYSKGINYARIIKEKKMTIAKLAESIGCSKPKLQNFLAFEKVPKSIWETTGNLSKVSSRTAATIYALSQKGEKYISALLDLTEDIRKGIGSRTVEQKVFKIVNGLDQSVEPHENIVLPSGIIIAKWTKDGLQFVKDISFNQREVENLLIRYFQKTLKRTSQQWKNVYYD